MHDQSSSDSPVSRGEQTTASDDARWQSRVLLTLLSQLPYPLSVIELGHELCEPEPDFAERDALKRAVQELRKSGLVQPLEDPVSLTRAARHFNQLLTDG